MDSPTLPPPLLATPTSTLAQRRRRRRRRNAQSTFFRIKDEKMAFWLIVLIGIHFLVSVGLTVKLLWTVEERQLHGSDPNQYMTHLVLSNHKAHRLRGRSDRKQEEEEHPKVTSPNAKPEMHGLSARSDTRDPVSTVS